MKKILVLAVHPDDETLGCGGTLLKHKANSEKISWLLATEMKKEDGYSGKAVNERNKQIQIIKKMYGFDNVHQLGFSPKKLDKAPMNKLIEKIAAVLNKVRPEVIYLPFENDIHSDHMVFFEAAYSCIKAFRCPFIKSVLMMEIISETELAANIGRKVFVPNYFVDITDYMDKKIKIMKIFKSEMGRHPFPRSEKNIRALATFRGAMAGCKYAESFMLLKQIC